MNDKIIANIKNFSLKVHNGNANKFHMCRYAYGDTRQHHVSFTAAMWKTDVWLALVTIMVIISIDRLAKLTKKSRIMQKKEIINVYTDRVIKVRKPAPFVRKSSFYIDRPVKESKTDRINFMLLQKLLHVKASVSTYN